MTAATPRHAKKQWINPLQDPAWWRASLARAGRTAIFVALPLLMAAVTITDVDWRQVTSTSGLAALLSFIQALAGLPEVDGETARPWIAAARRAVRSAAQAVIAGTATAVLWNDIDWPIIAGTAALAALTSLLAGVSGQLPEVSRGGGVAGGGSS